MNGAGELAHGMAHKAGMAAHLAFPHDAFKFRLGNKRSHRVDDHQIHRVGTHQHVGDVQRLLAVVRLGNEQFIDLHAQAGGIVGVQRMFCVHKSCRPPHLLTFGDDMQSQRGFARRLGAINFRHTATRDAADTEGEIQPDGTGGNDRNTNMGVVGKLHDGALSIFAFYGGQSGTERLFAGVLRGCCGNRGLFRHEITPEN